MSQLQKLKDEMARTFKGRTARECIESGKCVFCDEPFLCFKDKLSQKEYEISGMCQKCQDETFKEV